MALELPRNLHLPGQDDAAENHEAVSHAGQATHHHHSHAAHSLHTGGHHALQLSDVSVGFQRYANRSVFSPQETRFVIENLSLSLHEGEILALVGASGSGKTLVADTVMGLFAPNAHVSGEIWFDGKKMTERSLASLRGTEIAFVPQSVESLDPLQRVGAQIERLAQNMAKGEARKRRRELFARYRLDEEVARRYPFELSGGMARRILLIGALMNRPRIIVADEPTPGLDMELAVQAMSDFRLFANDGGSVLLITHDVELALRVADRIAVFQDGTVVEETAVANFASPDLLSHPFSRALWHALPEHGMREPVGDVKPRRSDAANGTPLRKDAIRRAPLAPSPRASLRAEGICFSYGTQQVLRDFSLTVELNERVALRAPSGTGKTTLCRILAGYLKPASGKVLVDGKELPQHGISPVQLIAQHPERMMDPAITVRKSLLEAAVAPEDATALLAWERHPAEHGAEQPENRSEEQDDASIAPRLLNALGIRRAWLERFPSELSGGELQRCCIARALIARPRYLVCDEISTMLDAATQAYLWHFLIDYAQDGGIGMVLVTHSDALLDHIATRVVEIQKPET